MNIVKTTINGQEVRLFDNINVQNAVNKALAALPADKKLAVVAHADLTGTSLSAVAKLNGSWSIMAGCYKPYSGSLSAEAEVIWSPF